MAEVPLAAAPERGTRVVLHLMEDAKSFTERFTLERIVREQSGHVPVPISVPLCASVMRPSGASSG